MQRSIPHRHISPVVSRGEGRLSHEGWLVRVAHEHSLGTPRAVSHLRWGAIGQRMTRGVERMGLEAWPVELTLTLTLGGVDKRIPLLLHRRHRLMQTLTLRPHRLIAVGVGILLLLLLLDHRLLELRRLLLRVRVHMT